METHVEPDCKTVKGSVFDTDEFTSDNDLERFGQLLPVNHQGKFADGSPTATASKDSGASPNGSVGRSTAPGGSKFRSPLPSPSSGTIIVTITCPMWFAALVRPLLPKDGLAEKVTNHLN